MASKSESLKDMLDNMEPADPVAVESEPVAAPVDPAPYQPVTPEQLTNVRKSTHGDWNAQSQLFDNLMWQLTNSTLWFQMNHMQRSALTNIALKIPRICTGNPYEPDHWDDIGGYALLGKGGHKS